MKCTNKFIYCLEGNWNKNPRSNQSIKPMLDLLYTFSKVKYIYHKFFFSGTFMIDVPLKKNL